MLVIDFRQIGLEIHVRRNEVIYQQEFHINDALFIPTIQFATLANGFIFTECLLMMI